MATLADLKTKLDMVLQEDANLLGKPEKEAFLEEAAWHYSKDRPRELVAAITGAGTYEYSLPSDWVEGFSVLKQVEYPAGYQVPCLLDDSEWLIYQGTAGKKLRFLSLSPGTAETALLTFTAPHALSAGTAGTSTLPGADQDAVVNLAGALACFALARKHAQAIEPTIGADSVQHLSKSGEYAKRGKELAELYKSHVAPAKDGAVPAASISGDWDLTPGWQDDRLTHPKRYR